ncbi:hypothetical protein [Anatilimnocola floriformis]|uniref:hypothetical protein n=1 Tax=Anatilimnocola floriformis TaxID=2948575 RepID=UPI0020C47909|nr:hypothetical protein [Anatilimnocola floriformis]
MQPNPYESPAGEDQPDQSNFSWRDWPLEMFLLGEPLLLLLFAALHRSQLGDHEAYVGSPLLKAEGLLLIVAFLVVLIAFARVVIFLTHGSIFLAAAESRRALVNGLLGVLATFLVIAAAVIDAPTLIYGT